MDQKLAARIAAFLAEFPGEHVVDAIAKGVRARRQAVAEVLFEDPRFSSRIVPRTKNKARVWSLTSVTTAKPGRPSHGKSRRASQCAKLMQILADGQWHTTKELNRRVPGRTNSRMSELRHRGQRSGEYDLQHDGVGFGPEFHRYRIVWLAADRAVA